MKTKNMRKKALLSSVAMLLVAVVALSGATYAWFSANADATVSTIYLRTERQSSLVLSADVIANADSATYTSTLPVTWIQTLRPVSGSVSSQDNKTLTFKKAVADTTAMTGVEATTPVDGVTNGESSDYLQQTILVKSSIASKVVLKSIGNAGDLENALRVAITVDNGTTAKTVIYAPNETNATQALTGGPSAGASGVTYTDLYEGNSTATGADFTFATQTLGTLNSTAIDVALTANTAAQMTITIWLEGNDANCINQLAGKTIGTFSDETHASGTGLLLTFTSVAA